MFDCRGEKSVGLVSFRAEWLQLTTSRAVGGEPWKVKTIKTKKTKKNTLSQDTQEDESVGGREII